jgi:hypothetical protein
VVNDYPVLACNSIEKCTRKDLNGEIRVHTHKLIVLEESDDEWPVEKREVSTQTRVLPGYMRPLDRKPTLA